MKMRSNQTLKPRPSPQLAFFDRSNAHKFAYTKYTKWYSGLSGSAKAISK